MSIHQVKIFTGTEGAVGELEHRVNEWLTESKARVVNIFGNIAPQSVLPGTPITPLAGADHGHSRRFGPSDIMLVVVYQKAG
ncbi:MAG: hypothetical protein KF699_00380 [Phycisphaeraceae bacterium]|nr:hypothetical protein [Phycisphaeraceae bacterium]MBX3406824.1 hypothetical protein [Phycisphaeraceae bacterium]